MKNKNLITRLVYKYGFTPEDALALVEHNHIEQKTSNDTINNDFTEWLQYRNS